RSARRRPWHPSPMSPGRGARGFRRPAGSHHPSAEDLLYELEVLAGDARPAVARLDVGAAALAERLAERLIAQQAAGARSEIPGSSVVEEPGARPLHVTPEHGGPRGREHRRALRPRLEDHEREALVGRRHDEGRRPRDGVVLLPVRAEAERAYGRVAAEL